MVPLLGSGGEHFLAGCRKASACRLLKNAQVQVALSQSRYSRERPDNGSRPKGGLFERSAEKSLGVRRTYKYVATTKDEGNDADGRFSATC